MTFAGTAMTIVGLSPRHKVVRPSLRAILRRPSSVVVNVLRCDSSIAHSELAVAALLIGPALAPATQNDALLLTQKTSRQHAVTPRFGGRLLNDGREEFEKVCSPAEGDGFCCDWRRTRTTSRGVTVHCCQTGECFMWDVAWLSPRRDVRTLPTTADSIFCTIEISYSGTSSTGAPA